MKVQTKINYIKQTNKKNNPLISDSSQALFPLPNTFKNCSLPAPFSSRLQTGQFGIPSSARKG